MHREVLSLTDTFQVQVMSMGGIEEAVENFLIAFVSHKRTILFFDN